MCLYELGWSGSPDQCGKTGLDRYFCQFVWAWLELTSRISNEARISARVFKKSSVVKRDQSAQ
jgi:hypothetical protein